MKVRNIQRHRDDKVELQMTPMIDIVFLLLVFFVFSFQFITPEGDFNVKMPIAAPSEGLPDEDQLPPIPVRLRAGAKGLLASISMGERQLWSAGPGKFAEQGFAALHSEIRGIVGDAPGPGAMSSTEVEFHCSYGLKFKYVIDAITAVSGYVADDGQTIVKIVEKIRFSQPKKPE